MTCEQCKYITVCMAQADCLGQIFDPNYDGEHGCTDFAPRTNADRIRAMSDEELAGMLNRIIICHQLRLGGWYCSKCPLYGSKPCDTEGIIDWLKQPAEGK